MHIIRRRFGNYLLEKVNTFMNPSNNPRVLSAVENIGLQSEKEPPVYVLSLEVKFHVNLCACMIKTAIVLLLL